ncbi:metallophosphoesterase [Modestobacter sp. SSW1-42]|uniref:metallophosphoesterase n=1 Tax=Modestobacter sp. SSW1-42 TaxID=596372 RepID=UPI003985B16B
MPDAPLGAVVRQLPDDTLLAFISDTHIGGEPGTDIFDSAGGLSALIRELGATSDAVELVLAGDFLDLLRMGRAGEGAEHVAAILRTSRYAELFDALREFARSPRHRVTYVIGNHDVEVWWNADVRRTLVDAGLVHDFALSYRASFAGHPDQVVYCEHGNQFDPTNAIHDYTDPLDTPLGAHIVEDVVRPIGTGITVTKRVDLREVNFVFPLAAIPQWIAGRVFYHGLSHVLRWLVAPLLVALVAQTVVMVSRSDDPGPTLSAGPLLLGVAYDLAVLLMGLVVLGVIGKRIADNVVDALAQRVPYEAAEGTAAEMRIRALLGGDRTPPLAGDLPGSRIAVFVSGHTHEATLTEVGLPDGRVAVVANTGCWLRQLQPVPARFGAPTVFVPVFAQHHVRVRAGRHGPVAELWETPRPAENRRLPLLERVAVLGRMPGREHGEGPPRLVATGTAAARGRAPALPQRAEAVSRRTRRQR